MFNLKLIQAKTTKGTVFVLEYLDNASAMKNDLVEKALHMLNSRQESRQFMLKTEQARAVNDLLGGKDVLAVLPTGFGKSLIFIVFLLADTIRKGEASRSSVLVVSPLKSIIADKIKEVKSFNCTAAELTSETISKISEAPPQFIYCSAESAVKQDFLDMLRDDKSVLHQSVSGIVADESHTVETWTGRRLSLYTCVYISMNFLF